MEEFETFIAFVRSSGTKGGNTSKEITLPARLVKFMGIEEEDSVKVMIKKVEME